MDSLDRRAEPGRALGSRHRLRLFAIAAWTGFLGATLTVMTALALLPAAAMHDAGWAELSIGFLCAWVLAMIPVSLALVLALPRSQRNGDGR